MRLTHILQVVPKFAYAAIVNCHRGDQTRQWRHTWVQSWHWGAVEVGRGKWQQCCNSSQPCVWPEHATTRPSRQSKALWYWHMFTMALPFCRGGVPMFHNAQFCLDVLHSPFVKGTPLFPSCFLLPSIHFPICLPICLPICCHSISKLCSAPGA